MKMYEKIVWTVGIFCSLGIIRNIYTYFFVDDSIFFSINAWIPIILLGLIDIYLGIDATMGNTKINEKPLNDFNVPRIKRDKKVK